MRVTDSACAVLTRGEHKTDCLSRMDCLPEPPGNSTTVVAGAGPNVSCEKLPGGASLLPGPGIPIRHSSQKNKAPNRAPKYQTPNFELRNSSDDKLLLPPWSLVPIYNLESTHDLVGKVRRYERWGMRKAASKEPSTRSSCSGERGCVADTENGFGFTSQNRSVIHACVRDRHTAVLPGAAKVFLR